MSQLIAFAATLFKLLFAGHPALARLISDTVAAAASNGLSTMLDNFKKCVYIMLPRLYPSVACCTDFVVVAVSCWATIIAYECSASVNTDFGVSLLRAFLLFCHVCAIHCFLSVVGCFQIWHWVADCLFWVFIPHRQARIQREALLPPLPTLVSFAVLPTVVSACSGRIIVPPSTAVRLLSPVRYSPRPSTPSRPSTVGDTAVAPAVALPLPGVLDEECEDVEEPIPHEKENEFVQLKAVEVGVFL